MIVRFWGTRGSLATAGPEVVEYGGNTASVEVRAADGACLALDAGTGIRRLGSVLPGDLRRVDVLLTHLHMDHIQGLGFFDPFFRSAGEVHVWGPASTTQDLGTRLGRYLSPPLFPVRLRDLDARVELHDLPDGAFDIGPFRVTADHVIHPGQTVGYRIEADGASIAYLPDHEPALAAASFPHDPAWTSGLSLADGADLLIHDAQYTAAERAERIGWGHSSALEAVDFARLAGAGELVLFHHDPSHSDATIDRMVQDAAERADGIPVSAAREGAVHELGRRG